MDNQAFALDQESSLHLWPIASHVAFVVYRHVQTEYVDIRGMRHRACTKKHSQLPVPVHSPAYWWHGAWLNKCSNVMRLTHSVPRKMATTMTPFGFLALSVMQAGPPYALDPWTLDTLCGSPDLLDGLLIDGIAPSTTGCDFLDQVTQRFPCNPS